MLKRLRIKNFKGWKDTDSIQMAPITLFFGSNSSGKSSIGHFLMMLKQTVESADRRAVFYPGGPHTAVQLGSYQEMVFGRDPNSNITFEYEWRLPEELRVKDPLSGATYSGRNLTFDAQVGLSDPAKHTLSVRHFRYTLLRDREVQLSIGMTRKDNVESEYEMTRDDYPLTRRQGRVWNPRSTVRFYGFPDEVVAYYQNADWVQELNLQHELLFRSISYLGPLRTRAERLYSWSGIEPESVGFSGEHTIAALLAARERRISLGPRRRRNPFEVVIANALETMGLIEQFQVRPISEYRREFEVRVKTKGAKDWVGLPDVGFGVSQVLPVLVQSFYAPPNSIIIMEQPEIHLHPRAQANLADVLISAVKAREEGKDRNIQLIIETHSEHFLRRLQRRIAEEDELHELVVAYFANTDQHPASLEPLQIDLYGNIRNWPANFFGDELGDIAKQAEAAMSKRKNAPMS